MGSVDRPGSKPPEQGLTPQSPETTPEEPVRGTHGRRKVKKQDSSESTDGLKNPERKKKIHSKALEKLRSKIKPTTVAPQIKASELSTKAVTESRIFF